jgi:hypothetical protein
LSKRINIVLLDETISVLDRVTSAKRAQSLRTELEAGYRANAGRDLEIAAEWFPLEEEASSCSSH